MANAPRWSRKFTTGNFSAVNTAAVTSLMSIDEESGGATLERLIVAGNSDADDPYVARIFVAPEITVQSDMDFNTPEDDSPLIWGVFYIARGPVVYDIRSKRSLNAGGDVWLIVHKLDHSVASDCHVYSQILYTER